METVKLEAGAWLFDPVTKISKIEVGAWLFHPETEASKIEVGAWLKGTASADRRSMSLM